MPGIPNARGSLLPSHELRLSTFPPFALSSVPPFRLLLRLAPEERDSPRTRPDEIVPPFPSFLRWKISTTRSLLPLVTYFYTGPRHKQAVDRKNLREQLLSSGTSAVTRTLQQTFADLMRSRWIGTPPTHFTSPFLANAFDERKRKIEKSDRRGAENESAKRRRKAAANGRERTSGCAAR